MHIYGERARVREERYSIRKEKPGSNTQTRSVSANIIYIYLDVTAELRKTFI